MGEGPGEVGCLLLGIDFYCLFLGSQFSIFNFQFFLFRTSAAQWWANFLAQSKPLCVGIGVWRAQDRGEYRVMKHNDGSQYSRFFQAAL